MPGALAVLAALAALGGCAAPAEPAPPGVAAILLPQEDGQPSSIVVRPRQPGGQEQVLNQPYQRALTQADGRNVIDQADATAVRRTYAPLFATQPRQPTRFTLYFKVGGTQLTEPSQALIAQALAESSRYAGVDVVVTGHTDRVGSTSSNDALSLRRAQQVRDLLVQRGFAAERIEAVGRGEREPVVPTADDVEEPRNRRVELTLR